MNSNRYLFTSALLLISFTPACGDDGGGGTGGTSSSGGASSGGATTSSGGVSASSGASSGGASNGGHAGQGGAANGIPALPVVMGTAKNFAILAKSGISTVPASAITGDLGVSPVAATSVTGFSLIMDAGGTFSTSTQVTGKVLASDYAVPTPTVITLAIHDMELAFTDAAGRPADVTELGAGNIGGMNLAPGVYKWGTGLLIPSDVTLSGSATAVWIFQIAQDLTMGSATHITLAGGALPKNVFWQVSGLVDLGTTAHFEGVLLSQTTVTLGTGASINGRLLAQMAVNLDANTVTQPAP